MYVINIKKSAKKDLDALDDKTYIRIDRAYDLMKKIDEKDTPFLALAMQLGCPIWSNDSHFKKLVGFEVYTTKDILKLLNIGPEVPE